MEDQPAQPPGPARRPVLRLTRTGSSTGYAKEFPDGRYEAGAEIGPDEWTNSGSRSTAKLSFGSKVNREEYQSFIFIAGT